MTKYKVIETEQETTEEGPVVELRLISRGAPILQGRNPGERWSDIVFLDNKGNLGLQLGSREIKGINTDEHDHIVTI